MTTVLSDDSAVSAESCSTHLVSYNNIQVYVCIEVERKGTVAERNARSWYLHDTIVASLGEHSGN